ncbi:hypothetical protein ACF0H5_021516 [Mactra antiquata]
MHLEGTVFMKIELHIKTKVISYMYLYFCILQNYENGREEAIRELSASARYIHISKTGSGYFSVTQVKRGGVLQCSMTMLKFLCIQWHAVNCASLLRTCV